MANGKSPIDWTKVQVLSTDSLTKPATAQQHQTPGERLKPSNRRENSQEWLRYANQGAIRSQPINDDLANAMSFLPEMGITMEVFSGGQAAKGSGGPRTGSVRHDHGGAADAFFYKDGRKLDWANEADRPIFQEIVRKARSRGVTGIGAGDGYMQPGSMHIGFGKEAVWGAGGKGANAPDWLRNAFHSPYDGHDHSAPQTARAAGGASIGQRLMGDLMSDFGLSRMHASALVGNLDHESGGFKMLQELDPTVPGSRGGAGYGMWTGPRRKAFEQYVKENNLDPASYEANYGFLKHEITNDPYEAKQFAKFLATDTVDDATRVLSDSYLRPGKPNLDSRLARAQAYFGGEGAASGDAPVQLTSAEWGGVPVVQADGSLSRPQSNARAHLQPGSETPEDEELMTRFGKLDAEAPGRYRIIPEDQYEAWKADWDAQNQSSGLAGDTTRLLKAGWSGLGLGVREAVRAIPGVGEGIVETLDSVDEWMHGQKSEALLGGQIDKAVATLTPATRNAREKHWWDSEKGRPGAAWADPRSYYAGIVESIPGTVVTMGPSLGLARGAYVTAIASGATQKTAAAAAARTALVAGAITEGIVGGGQAAVSVREQIDQMPRQALEESQAVQQLMKEGLSFEDAVEAVKSDASTQAFVIAGAATGAFGGFGDHVLAKILADGVGGTLAQRIVKGATRDAVAEGILEEAPQEAGAQVAENIALKNTVDPHRDLTEGVANAAAGGVAVGGAMGAGMGGAGGALSPANDSAAPAEPAGEPITPDRTPRRGALAESVDYAERRVAETSGNGFFIHDPAIAGMPAGELNGVEVQITPDQDGVPDNMRRVVLPDGQTHVLGERLLVPKQLSAPTDTDAAPVPAGAVPDGAPAVGSDVHVVIEGAEPVMGRVEGYEDGEAVVMDVGTGELLQVPLDAVEAAPAVDVPISAPNGAPVQEDLPDDLPGSEPIPAETTTSPLPPEAETGDLGAVPFKTPKPGQRVIVAAEGLDRFPATVQTFEEDGDEVLVKADDGRELQVPREALRVSRLTDAQTEELDLKENPPVERETITNSDPKAREVRGAQVVLPDERHARLFDLGKLRRDSKKTLGRSTLDMDQVSPGEQSRLADEFGLSPQRLGQIADDYRFRVEAAANKATTRTPIHVNSVNNALLNRMKDEDRRDGAADLPFEGPEPAVTDAAPVPIDWDALPTEARKAILTAARVKRAPSTRWADFPANIQKKLAATQQVSTEDNAVPAPAVPAAPATPPTFDAFKAALPKDKDGLPDISGTGKGFIESIGGAGSNWGDLDDDARARAIALAQGASGVAPAAVSVEEAAQEAATSPQNDLPEPTQAQKEAGNYRKGHVALGGFDIAIENPKGSERKGVDPSGKRWSITMKSHYGYFKGTVGRDKDHIDLFLRPGTEQLGDSDPVFVIDQINPGTRSFDEHKVMLGFKNKAQATRAYNANYTKGWKGIGEITETTVGDLKAWFEEGNTAKPFAKAKGPEVSGERSGPSEGQEPKRTAPEHIHNKGKPLDPDRTYPFTADDQPVTREDASLDEKVAAEAALLPELTLAQFREVTDHWASLFKGPEKQRSLTKELKGAPYLKPAQAKALVEVWKEHALQQQETHRAENFNKTILSLFDYTGQWSQPWEDAGYNVIRFDLQNGQDIMDFSVGYFNENWDFSDVYGILAACPCTDFAVSGARHFAAKDADGRTEASKELVFQTMRTIEYFRPWGFWALENPVGRIGRLTGLPPWRLGFDPNHFGEDYTKKTLIWGDFNAASMPVANAEPTAGSKMHQKYGGKSLKTKNSRSGTPEGFAYSFFMGNNYADADPAYMLPRRYPDASGAIKAALKAGMDPKSVNDLMQQTYEYDDAEAARSALLKEIRARTKPSRNESSPKKLDVPEFKDVPGLPDGNNLVAVFKHGASVLDENQRRRMVKAIEKGDDAALLSAFRRDFARNMTGIPANSGKSVGFSGGRAIHHDYTQRPPAETEISEKELIGVLKAVFASDTKKTAPRKTDGKKPVAAKSQFSGNKLFTEDKVTAARKRLRAKLNQVNSGIDPEVLVDGMTIAGAYIEAGVRKFSDYAKAMVQDLGPNVRPYLLSFYEGARNYPGLETDGMDSVADAKAAFDTMMAKPAAVTKAMEKVVGTVSESPKPAKKRGKSAGDKTLTQDWGVEHIDGWSQSLEHFGTDTDFGVKGGVKDAFLKEAQSYLKAVEKELAKSGFTKFVDHKGNADKRSVSVNPAGPAVSGDVSLVLSGPDGAPGVYVTIGETALRGGFTPHTKQGVAIMWRINAPNNKYGTRGGNNWAKTTLTATELATILRKGAGLDSVAFTPAAETQNDDTVSGKRSDPGSPSAKSADGVRGNEDGGNTPDLFGQPDQPVERERKRGAQPGNRGSAQRSEPDVSGKPAQSPAGSEQPVSGRRGNRDGAGDRADRRLERKPSRDYRVKDGELTRKGSWRETAERNVQIVELVKQLESEGREATTDERALMVQFTGWGASEIANGVFPNRYGQYKDDKWKALGERLKAALSEDDYKTAARSTQYAHYTSEAVIRSIYDGLKRIGIAGGRVLEPGMGIGHFLGVMPSTMAGASQYTGIEFDGVTTAIAKHLYPDSRITHGDYTKTKLPKSYFDLAIGNPPFAQTKITNDPEYRKYGFSLHDYFFAKTIDRVKPGGVMVFVTSRYTLDKVRDAGRRYLAERANLLGAIRLPQTAFQANAGTEVVTDVLFLQKRGPGIEENGIDWTGTKEIKVGEDTFTVNEYIADHPEMVLGAHAATGSMYRKNDYTVTPDKGKDIEAAFADAVKNLPEAVYKPERGSKAEQAKVIEKDFDPKAKKEGGLYLSDNGDLMIRQDGVGQAFTERQTTTGKLKPLSKREAQFLKDFVALRDAVKQTQYDQLTDGDWEASLKVARETYRGMVERNGHILAYSTIERTDQDGNTQSYKRFKNEPLFMIDPDGPLAFTLEKITESGDIVEGALFKGRVLNNPSEPEIVTTQDALFVSLDKLGRFDLADIAERAGRSEEDTVADLGTSIYEDPGDGWQLADEYLSGNVVQKLAEARAAAELDPKYTRNVDALLTVQPRPLGTTEIDVKLGVPWLPASDIEAFGEEVLGQTITVNHNLKVGTWQVSGNGSTIGEFAMDNHSTADILNKILNNSQLRITRPTLTADGKKSTETDPEATEKLNDIARKIKDRFRSWIWKDADRAKRLVNFYNDNYNNIAPRQFDGSHLTLPGTSLRFNLYPHQKRTIWRAIQTGDTYLAHAVGAGKTFEMIAIGMEERRLGLSKKPLFVVPNHMLGQFQREFLELYPAANIMVADEKNFHTSNRRKFIAQAALNDPDAIIITHSAFGRIGLSDETNDKQIQDLIDEWKELQDEIEAVEGKGLSFKRTQSQIERLEKRLQGKQKREAKDAVMTFEELGVDRLLIDELHEFRKLDFVTNQGAVKGIDPQGSQRAMDLHSKVTYLREANKDPKRVLVGASGTPVTNTMGELFTVQRLFQPDVLEDIGAHNFDAWAAQFGDIVEGLEQNAAGKFETVSRFARFQNVPELMRRVRSFMDILTSSSLGALVQRPTRLNPPREIKTTPTPDGYKAYQDQLNRRMNAIRDRKGPPKKGEDIILKVIADGRFSAIDMRFVHPTQDSDPNSKLNQLLDDVIADYRATADNEYVGLTGGKDPLKGSTLVIFSDIGLGDAVVKSRGFDMKGWIEQRLLDAGIPKDHFAFIRDHKAHAKKERLFADLREGRKRILIGGKDMETGVNVQKRLTHLYHLDAPWFPASVEQREGRADRQGNQNADITIRAYATKGSYDSTMWSMNARKARFIEQALNGDDSVRKMEDVSEASAFEMAAALSSGDPRYLQLAGLRQEVDRLGRLRKAHFDEQNRYKREEHSEEGLIGRLVKEKADFEAAAERGQPIKAGAFSAALGKKTFDKRDEWAKALFQKFSGEAVSQKESTVTLGTLGGHDVNYYGKLFEDGSHKAALAIDLPGGMADLAEHPSAEEVTVGGIGQRAVNQVNSIFDKPGELGFKIEQAERRLKQVKAQIGAPFPEEALYLEKQGELSELELELQNEKGEAGQSEADKAGSAKDLVEEEAAKPSTTDMKLSRRQEPVTRLSGTELLEFNGPEDMPALRQAAVDWYRENLIGRTVTTKDGLDIRFKARGLKKSTYGRKGDVLLRSVPSIKAILEHGDVVLSEAGNRQGVIERQVIAAPVELEGTIRHLAVTIHKSDDGNWHYDLHIDREAEGSGVQGPDGPAAKLSRLSALEGALGSFNLIEWRPKGKKSADLRTELAVGPLADLTNKLIEKSHLRIATSVPADLPSDTQAFTDDAGTITLIDGAIPEGKATAVLLHEAFHAGQTALFRRKVWDKLEKRLGNLYLQYKTSGGAARKFFDAARLSVERTGAAGELAVEEFGAYAIEAYEAAPRTVQRWAQNVIGAVKAWMLTRFGRQIGTVTPAQLRALAVAALKDKTGTGTASAGRQGKARLSRRFEPNTVREQISGRWTDLSPSLLSLVPLNYFQEMKRPGMGAIDRYLKVKRLMDTYRGEKHETMDAIAQTWRKFSSRNRKAASALAELMHDATLASIDPAVNYGDLQTPKGYDSLKARFDALPPAARALYKQVRNAYVKIQAEMDKLILDNVQKAQEINEKEAKKRYEASKAKVDRDPKLSEPERREKLEDLAARHKADLTRSRFAAKARMSRLRQTFEKNRVPAPYFPLARFGEYFVTVRDMAGDVISFTRFERDADRRRWMRENKRKIEQEYPGVVFEQGVLGESGDVRQAMDPRMVAEIDGILKDANVDQEVMDAIYQKWLQSMPDLSVRKRYIHRKGTSGFHQDALRSFASHMFHAGHQMGKLKYGIDLQEAVGEARDQARQTDDPTRAGQLVNELTKRHDWVMNPKGSKLAQKINSAAFVWYLAATPAAAIINMTQPILFGIPVLGARLGGVTKASAALLKASGDILRGKGDISRGNLTADEKRALKEMYASGAIDRTMAMEIAGIGDSGVEYMPLRHEVMKKISWLFHNAEVVNREVTALAAYRLARAKGQPHAKAVDTAHELNFTVNYDYANSSRPRILQSDFAKVAGVFMSYQLNVWYRIFRDIQQSFAGDTKQARKEARYQLAGLMGMQVLMGGTSGFFMYNVLMALAGLFFDDEDDPFSFKHEAERAIFDLFGEEVGGMIVNGVPGHLTGIDLTSRVGMADFFLRMPDGSKEGKDWWLEFVAGSLGASVGAVGNMVVGAHYISEGDTERGLELMVPKAVKDVMKAWRYANEGLLTRKDDVILPRDDIDAWDVILQASGFTPAKIATAHKLRGAKYDAQNRIKQERSALINRIATAIRNGDVEARKRAIKQIVAWNRRDYAKVLPITRETLERSLKTRARLAARREDGFLPINERVGAYLAKRSPENPYR